MVRYVVGSIHHGAISNSSQCSTMGETNTVVCAILLVRKKVNDRIRMSTSRHLSKGFCRCRRCVCVCGGGGGIVFRMKIYKYTKCCKYKIKKVKI